MTEDILIAESEDMDRTYPEYWDGLEIRADSNGITARSEDWPSSDTGFISHETQISWADLLKHAPAEALLEAAKQKIPAPKTGGRLTNADCINWGILTDLDMILCDEGPLEYKEDLIRWVTGRIRDRYYDIEIPPGDPPASTP